VAASNSQIYQKDLVQKTATQLFEYGHEENHQAHTKPVVELYWVNNYWNYFTKGMSKEELTDFTQAKEQLVQYEKLYSLIEYCSLLNDNITCL